MDTVECPGCLKQFDPLGGRLIDQSDTVKIIPVLTNDRTVGVVIKSADEESTVWSNSYCSTCWKRVEELDHEELVGELETLVRHRMVMEDLAKLGKVK